MKDGGIADSRAKMEAILAANPAKGAIAAVWAAWDQPALGAMQAIEAAGRGSEGIVITGIDANPQAREAIAKGGNFEASMAQDFKGIGRTTADAVKRYLAGRKNQAGCDLRADEADHRGKCEGVKAGRRSGDFRVARGMSRAPRP